MGQLFKVGKKSSALIEISKKVQQGRGQKDRAGIRAHQHVAAASMVRMGYTQGSQNTKLQMGKAETRSSDSFIVLHWAVCCKEMQCENSNI